MPWVVSLVAFCILAPATAALPGPVVRPYVEPACEKCAGHRGVTVASAPGTAVTAGFAGTVTFDGPVGGVRYVVVALGGGLVVTYGRLGGTRHPVGLALAPGARVGFSTGRVYLGVRRHGRPVDPRILFVPRRAALGVPRAHRCGVAPRLPGGQPR